MTKQNMLPLNTTQNKERQMAILLMLHSIVRWLIVLVAFLAIIKFGIGAFGSGAFKPMDRGLSSGFSGLMDLQVMLGLIYFLWNGFASSTWPAFRFEHMSVMLVAAAVAHLPARWKNAPDKTRFRNALFAVLFALFFVYVGVSLLPNGWAG
jgi:hypothetical protein